jgi:S-layer family protein
VTIGFGVSISVPPNGGATFADVVPQHPFFRFIETAAHAGIAAGYTCGGAGEPCDGAGRPYFRPNNPVTRGRLAKIVVGAAAWPRQAPPTGTFADVAADSPFYPFVETAFCGGIISGYTCSGPGEPCDNARRPYYRPRNNSTRGQIAKIVYGALTTGATSCSPMGPNK